MCFRELLFEIWRHILFIKCFFVGHVPCQYDPPYGMPYQCYRCLYNDDQINIQDGFTMPDILCRAYTRLCAKNWHWFEVLDEWLYLKLTRWINPPSWWA
ncbi:MAG TPA: hypothetical protein VMY98_07300 [Anaerolineae bacterium]|nr:hypothetical protein [Anaerolineae bacterium]